MTTMHLRATLALGLLATSAAAGQGDRSVRIDGSRFSLATASVEHTLALVDGRFNRESLRGRPDGLEWAAPSREFSFRTGSEPGLITGQTPGWTLDGAAETAGPGGERLLSVTLRRGAVSVSKTYVVHPGSSVVRESWTLTNAGTEPLEISDVGFLEISLRAGDLSRADFHWMTGGYNHVDSWQLRTERLLPGRVRVFDSNDPFPAARPDAKARSEFHPGSFSYAPWVSIFRPETRDGMVLGWDYFGRWSSSFTPGADGTVAVRFRIEGYRGTLAPGASFRTPSAFTALYRDHLDEAGNELLDWQYRYLWDLTRERTFASVRMLGHWDRGTAWGRPGTSWLGGPADVDSLTRKVFRVADLMRQVGGDVYHRDWGWWDRAGDWNGPDFAATRRYLDKYGMGQTIYAFVYTVDPGSRVGREHPEWLLGNTLDMSRPDVVRYLRAQLDGFTDRWGAFDWRNDSDMTSPRGHDESLLPGQDRGLRELFRGFVEAHPDCSFHAVNGGGTYAGYDYVRMATVFQFTDGQVGLRNNYHASLLFPPDKIEHIPEFWDVGKFDPASFPGALSTSLIFHGDTIDPENVEGLRRIIDLYRYLKSQGVVGRGVRVYRPRVQGDDPVFVFQRMSADRLRGVVLLKHRPPGPLTIFPRGLTPGVEYDVSFRIAAGGGRCQGADLMERGIRLDRPAAGELVFLNLSSHPENRRDVVPPTAPALVRKASGEHLGQPGVELSWTPSSDESWVSGYEILRDGAVLERTAQHRFYFDHSVGADLAASYEVRAVDGSGNRSAPAPAQGPQVPRSQVWDDRTAEGLELAGAWERTTSVPPAHAGSLSVSGRRGDRVELRFEGRRILVFVQLGPDGGKAALSLDDGPSEVVDTYSADEIWGWCAFRKELAPGTHRLRIETLGEGRPGVRLPRVRLDGFRAEP